MSLEESVRPTIGITMGDAAGIGPEIVLKALANEEVKTACRCVIIGDAVFLRRTSKDLGLDLRFAVFEPAGGASGIEIFDVDNLRSDFRIGTDNGVSGKASAQYIEEAVKMWNDGRIDAICTAPISKKAISLGGYEFPGHTEFLALMTQTNEFAMSFFADKLRVVLLSTHLPLTRAIEQITQEKLISLITFADRELTRLLGRKVSIAVAGLNPHASEGGMFGSEEKEKITPAINHCRSIGIDASGPYSPDTIFLRGFKGDFDSVIALYHDQATIAVKSLSFGAAVNVTLGLPLIRTSVDHGTAFDIAGQGLADPASMISAIRLAAELAADSPMLSHLC